MTETSPPRQDDDPEPLPPIPPEPEACCGSGCDPCIFDFYSEELQEYRLKHAQWLLRQNEKTGTKLI